MNPGSQDAITNGCTCPVMDNGYGKGAYGDGEKFGWWINETCPLHGNSNTPKKGYLGEEEKC